MSEWISVKERLPAQGAFWVCQDRCVSFCSGTGDDTAAYFLHRPWINFWMAAEMIPAPPKSEPEQAFDDWAKVHPVPDTGWISGDYAKTCFLAGFEAGRSAK